MENSKHKIISMITVQSTSNNCSENENPPRKINFAVSFRPIYYFLRVFGFMPFKIVYNSNGEIEGQKITAFDIVWLLISLSFYLFAIDGNKIWSDIYTLRNFSSIVIFIRKASFILEILFYIIGILMDFHNRRKLVNILQNVDKIDKEVSLTLIHFINKIEQN